MTILSHDVTLPPSSEGPVRVDVDGMVDAIVRLVRVPSVGGRESEAQDLVADEMAAVGLEVDRWAVDLAEIQADPHAAWEIEREAAVGLVGTLAGHAAGPTLVLNGHVDVVPAGDPALWRHPPFAGVVEGGRIHGRGSLDMKGPLMAGLYALKAVRDAGIRLAGTVHLQSVVGEEDGGLGTLATIRRGYRGDAAIVMEPTGLTVAPVQAGCLNFRVEVPGLAAHGAVREEGVSAFEKLFDVHRALQRLEARRNEGRGGIAPFAWTRLPYPISVGTLRGGDWASSVPDHAAMEGRMGVRPDESFDAARAELEAAVAAAAAADDFLQDHPPRVVWWGGRYHPAATAVDHPIVTALLDAHRGVTGVDAAVRGVTYGSDAGLLERVGGASVVIYGAGDIRDAHRPNESVSVAELVTMAEVLAGAIAGYCGGE